MNILIVDDSPATRKAVAEVVQQVPGAVVEEAGDGVEALKALKVAPYDLVFLDINMPMMDGLKLLGRIAKDPTCKGTRVAVFTDSVHPVTDAQARGLGARYFVHKPIDRREVERILREVLGPRA